MHAQRHAHWRCWAQGSRAQPALVRAVTRSPRPQQRPDRDARERSTSVRQAPDSSCGALQLGGAGPAAYMPARVEIESLLSGGNDAQGADLTPCARPLLLVTPVQSLPGQVLLSRLPVPCPRACGYMHVRACTRVQRDR